MCTGAEYMYIAGTVGSGLAGSMYRDAQAEQLRTDAAGERAAGAQQAKVILRATERQRAAARAATAASGARIDEFSLANEQEILQAGETDAAMAILGAERKGKGLEIGAKLQKAAGRAELAQSLFSASTYGMGKWRGAKYGSNDIPGVNGSNAMDRWLQYGKSGD